MATCSGGRRKRECAVGAGGGEKISRTAGDLRACDGVSGRVYNHSRDRAEVAAAALLFVQHRPERREATLGREP